MPDGEKPDIQRSLADLMESSRRLREKAKENVAEADRIMAVVKSLEKVWKEQSARGEKAKKAKSHTD